MRTNKKYDESVRRNLALHAKVMAQLISLGMDRDAASKEALRRMREKKFRFDHAEDYFTALEIDMKTNKLKCRRCGHSWLPRTAKPTACPACKQYTWDKTPKGKNDEANRKPVD